MRRRAGCASTAARRNRARGEAAALPSAFRRSSGSGAAGARTRLAAQLIAQRTRTIRNSREFVMGPCVQPGSTDAEDGVDVQPICNIVGPNAASGTETDVGKGRGQSF